MFDFGWTELLVIAVVAIIVVGPKDLPGMFRSGGQMLGRLRRMAGEFQKTFNDAVKDAEKQAGVEDIRKEVDSVRKLNPINDLKKTIEINPDSSTGNEGKKSAEITAQKSEGASAENSSNEIASKGEKKADVNAGINKTDKLADNSDKMAKSESNDKPTILDRNKEVKKNWKIHNPSILNSRMKSTSGIPTEKSLVSSSKRLSLNTDKRRNLLDRGAGIYQVRLAKNTHNMVVHCI